MTIEILFYKGSVWGPLIIKDPIAKSHDKALLLPAWEGREGVGMGM